MRFPCEISARYVIPALRLMIAKKLIEEHNLTQAEVAELLGVTQPSISHYLNSKRGVKMARILSRSKEIRDYVDAYVEKAIARGSPPEDMPFCMICELAVKRVMGKHGVAPRGRSRTVS
ncbi:MAG: helix-turn-helix domain-containing protein [Aigarchaeota archaeon]|nr:helix-turn-helix domain-containing protein [Candidatus Wolframiiraptor gerlachensis]